MTRLARAAATLTSLALLSGCALLGPGDAPPCPSEEALAKMYDKIAEAAEAEAEAEAEAAAAEAEAAEPETVERAPREGAAPGTANSRGSEIGRPPGVARPAAALGEGYPVPALDPAEDLAALVEPHGQEGASGAVLAFLSGWLQIERTGDPTLLERVSLPACGRCAHIAGSDGWVLEGFDLVVDWTYWALAADVGEDSGVFAVAVTALAIHHEVLENGVDHYYLSQDTDVVYDVWVRRVDGAWGVVDVSSRPWKEVDTAEEAPGAVEEAPDAAEVAVGVQG